MNKVACIFWLSLFAIVNAGTLDEYIQDAQKHIDAKEIDEAIAAMEQAVSEYPESISSIRFSEMAKRMLTLSPEACPDGNIKFFCKKLVSR